MQIISMFTQRLDKCLAVKLNQSRNQIINLIKSSHVSVNGITINKAGYELKQDDVIKVQIQETPKKIAMQEFNLDIEIIYEDDDILVINKPSNLTVHPAESTKEPTLVDYLVSKNISLSSINGEERHGIVHRLDRPTSGVMVVAKTNDAHIALSAQLETRSMGRYYLAIINPMLKEDITIEKPIGRNPINRLKFGIYKHGRYAKSDFVKISTSQNSKYELISAKLHTGRTHQIRAHLASISRHILGDKFYGSNIKLEDENRIFLHAYILYLTHPTSKEQILFVANIQEDMQKFLDENFEKASYEGLVRRDTLIHRFS